MTTPNVTIYSTLSCPYCVRAKQLLERKGVAFKEINLSNEAPEVRIELMQRTNHRTVPQIFIKDQFIGGFDQLYALEREVPGAQVFTKQWQPELNINLSSAAEKIDPTHYEVSLKVVVQANNENETAFIVDVTQSGIFLVDGVEEDRLPYILGAYCPNILFPFLREAVNDLVTKGSFPQLLLTPINFDAEFEANMQRLQADADAQGQA
ncbi:UNVERIFIED_CONTAM: secB [Trichonephila clavipes]